MTWHEFGGSVVSTDRFPAEEELITLDTGSFKAWPEIQPYIRGAKISRPTESWQHYKWSHRSDPIESSENWVPGFLNPDTHGLLHAVLIQLQGESQEEIERENLRQKLFATESHDEVLEILTQNDLERFVADYQVYLEQRQETRDEDERPGIILQSLQSWAWFLISYAAPMGLPYTMVDADIDGCIELEWRLSDEPIEDDPDNEYWGNGEGIALLRFYPSHMNALSILSGPYACERRRLAFESCMSHTKTRQILDLFAERLLDGDD